MRKVFLATIAAGTLASIGMTASPALARDYPFCIKGPDYDSAIGDSSFDTYRQCLATASGRRAYCDANPFFAYMEKLPRISYPTKPRRGY